MWRRFHLREPVAANPGAQSARRAIVYGFTVLCGLLASFSVHLVGTLFIGEMLMLAAFPFLILFAGRRLRRRGLPIVFLLLGYWLLGQILSDIYRSTKLYDWLRGDANILMFAVDLAVLAILFSWKEQLKSVFIASYAIGSLLAVLIQPSPEAQ